MTWSEKILSVVAIAWIAILMAIGRLLDWKGSARRSISRALHRDGCRCHACHDG